MRRVYVSFADAWRAFLGWVTGLLVLIVMLTFGLGTLVPNFAAVEKSTIQSSRTIRTIAEDPLYLPHKVGLYAVQKIKRQSPLVLRSVSAVYGAVLVGLMFYILRRWHTYRVALLGTLLFVSSSWFLHIARLATPDITYLFLLGLIAYGIWLQNTKQFELALAAGTLLAAASLYIPALVWFILPLGIWQLRPALQYFRQVQVWWRLGCLILFVGLVAPLVLALSRSPNLILTWIGLPETLPFWQIIGQNLAAIPTQLFVRGPADSVRWLGNTPLLDIFTAAMFVLGLYAYCFRRSLARTQFLLGSLVLGSLLIALGGPVSIAILLPAIYLITAAGITLMLQQWFTVFPRNPVARSLGTLLLIGAVGLACFYNINHYFVAWPNTPETKQVFTEKL